MTIGKQTPADMIIHSQQGSQKETDTGKDHEFD